MRTPVGEHGPVRIPTGEHGPVRLPTGEQAPVRVPTGEQRPVPVISGNPPGSATDEDQEAGPEEAPEALETVDLSSRMGKQPEDSGEPGPDTTAVLETEQTVDLSSRLEQEKVDRHH